MIGSLHQKLILMILPLCLLPLGAISVFSYFVAKDRITQDRIVLYLEQIAQNVMDTMRLTLLEKKEETISMGLHSEFRDYLLQRTSHPPQLLLDQLLIIHQVYDLLILFDVDGNLVITSSINRNRLSEPQRLESDLLQRLQGQSLRRLTPDDEWLQQVRSGRFGYIDWHISPIVHELYRYADEDAARQYSIGFAAPILDERGVVIGGLLNLMNWEHFQEILDKVEEDLEVRRLSSGYAFLFGNDHNTIIGHKYRRNRSYTLLSDPDLSIARDNYGTRLIQDHHLADLQTAVVEGRSHHRYEYPPGTAKISGLAGLNHEYFLWVCGVGINDEDIFSPVQNLKYVLIWATSISALLVFVLTYSVARQISVPLKRLTEGVAEVEAGEFNHRVEVTRQDEIGELAQTFNRMAHSLQERSQALVELNRDLEHKVQERTRELEQKHRELEQAYQELKETQVQLVQSEKMASLGQLVAGIAHEIKNPLNFIYGNTEFLSRYVESLLKLISIMEEKANLEPSARNQLQALKEEIRFDFMVQDLKTLIAGFEEGACRIHSIIDDLRTFSRMDSEEFQEVDLHDSIGLALNLLHNQYRDRIRIHKEFGDLPRIQCHPGRMSQVFMNLISNACQAIPSEGDIWIRTSVKNGQVVAEVEDNGKGIAPRFLERVFEPFFTTKPVGEGTGLGLSISYGIIQRHRGVIRVQSQEGRGTKFSVYLPIDHQNAAFNTDS